MRSLSIIGQLRCERDIVQRIKNVMRILPHGSFPQDKLLLLEDLYQRIQTFGTVASLVSWMRHLPEQLQGRNDPEFPAPMTFRRVLDRVRFFAQHSTQCSLEGSSKFDKN